MIKTTIGRASAISAGIKKEGGAFITAVLEDHPLVTGSANAHYNPAQHFWQVRVDLQRRDGRGSLAFDRQWLMLEERAEAAAQRLSDVLMHLTTTLTYEA